jgi:hypothetical protein
MDRNMDAIALTWTAEESRRHDRLYYRATGTPYRCYIYQEIDHYHWKIWTFDGNTELVQGDADSVDEAKTAVASWLEQAAGESETP